MVNEKQKKTQQKQNITLTTIMPIQVINFIQRRKTATKQLCYKER